MASAANSTPTSGPEQRADDGGDHALVADDAPDLALGGADGAQQPELARALVDGQEEAVGDPEQRDHEAHGQQRVEQVDDLVDLLVDEVAVLLVGAHLGGREAVERGGDPLLHLGAGRRRDPP